MVRSHTRYQLGIDLGDARSVAAVCRGTDGPAVVPLGGENTAVESLLFVYPDGSFKVGGAASICAATAEGGLVSRFKSGIGEGSAVTAGAQSFTAEAIAAAFVSWIAGRVTDREGCPPTQIAVAHPATWGSRQRQALSKALSTEGLEDVDLVSEPQAAALAYAGSARIDAGTTFGIYDSGGGTFDASVVRKLDGGAFELLDQPMASGSLSASAFDDHVLDHVRRALGDAWYRLDPVDPVLAGALAGLRRECAVAKELLSRTAEVMIPVTLPGIHTHVVVRRAEFEELVRPTVDETVDAFRRTVESSGVDIGSLDTVLLAGGGSQIPLVARLVADAVGRPISLEAEPKALVASGAALLARDRFEMLIGRPRTRSRLIGSPGSRRYARGVTAAAALVAASLGATIPLYGAAVNTPARALQLGSGALLDPRTAEGALPELKPWTSRYGDGSGGSHHSGGSAPSNPGSGGGGGLSGGGGHFGVGSAAIPVISSGGLPGISSGLVSVGGATGPPSGQGSGLPGTGVPGTGLPAGLPVLPVPFGLPFSGLPGNLLAGLIGSGVPGSGGNGENNPSNTSNSGNPPTTTPPTTAGGNTPGGSNNSKSGSGLSEVGTPSTTEAPAPPVTPPPAVTSPGGDTASPPTTTEAPAPIIPTCFGHTHLEESGGSATCVDDADNPDSTAHDSSGSTGSSSTTTETPPPTPDPVSVGAGSGSSTGSAILGSSTGETSTPGTGTDSSTTGSSTTRTTTTGSTSTDTTASGSSTDPTSGSAGLSSLDTGGSSPSGSDTSSSGSSGGSTS